MKIAAKFLGNFWTGRKNIRILDFDLPHCAKWWGGSNPVGRGTISWFELLHYIMENQ